MNKQLFTINEVAKLLGVSIKTLRRWDQKGLLQAQRTIGNQRRYALEDIERLKGKKVKAVIHRKQVERSRQVGIAEAAAFLGISVKTLRRWEAKGVVTSHRSPTNQRFFLTNELAKLRETKSEPVIKELPEIQPAQTVFNPTHSYAETHMRSAATFFSVLGVILTIAAFGGSIAATQIAIPVKKLISFLPQYTTHEKKAGSQNEVLATETTLHDYRMKVSVPAEFLSTASVSGKLTAPNILYSVVAGDNITISGDTQNPTISAHVDNLQTLGVTAGEGIAIAGTTITNTDLGSSQKIFSKIKVGSDTLSAGSNNDTFELAAGNNVTLSTDTSNKKITISADSTSTANANTITVQEGDVTVSSAINTLDFLGGDFDVGESPTGEANVSLASTLTSVTGVAGSFAVGTSATVGTTLNVGTNLTVGNNLKVGVDTINDLTGSGLAVSGSTLNVNLTTLGGAGSSQSNSGLEVGANGLTLLKGCTDGQILKWDDINTIWYCAADSGAGASVGGTGAANQVAFWTDPSTLSSTANFYWNNTNQLLGINTNGAPVAALDLRASSVTGGTTPIASLSGQSTFAGLLVDNSGTGDLFTASSSGLSRFVIKQNGNVGINKSLPTSTLDIAGTLAVSGTTNLNGNTATGALTVSGTTTFGGIAYTWPGSQSNGQVLQTNGSGTLSWVDPGTLPTSDDWDSLNGVITPKIETQDLLLGAQATNSARFAFINVASGTPTASISGTGANALSFDGNGTISTTNKQTLALGNASTGDINLVLGTGNNLRVNGNAGATISVTAQCVTAINGIVTGTGVCPSVAANTIWNTGSGAIFEGNTTEDLLIGAVATDSARFAVINVAGGTPIASLSAGTAGGAFLTADGSLQTTAKQSLTLGGGGTGTIVLANNTIFSGTITQNGSGQVTFGGNIDANAGLDVANASLTVGGSNAIITTAGVITGTQLNIDNLRLDANTLSSTASDLILDSASGVVQLADLTTNGVVYTSGTNGTLNSEAQLSIARGGTGTNSTPTNGKLLIGNASNGYTVANLTAGSGITISNGDGSITIAQTGSGASKWTQDAANGVIYPNISTLDILLGGTSSSSAKFAFLNNAGGTPVASIAGNLTLDNTGSIQTTKNQTLTIGGTDTGNIILSPLNGSGNVRINGTTTLNGLTYTWPGTQSSGQILQTNGSGILSWVDPGTLPTSDDWDSLSGVITPKIETQDLLLGAQATNSARFAVINISSGTPTASLSAGVDGGAFLSASGILQTSNYQSLTLGGGNTGDISLSAKGGTGTLALSANLLTINGTPGITSVSPTCVSFTKGIVTGSGNCGAGQGGSVWTLDTTHGTIYPINTTVDFLIGGESTGSAKFAVINAAGGTPVASVSAGTNGASFLTANGNLQTTNNQSLTLGSGNTGDINLSVGSNNLRINGTVGATIGAATCVTAVHGIVTGTGSCTSPASIYIWDTNSGAIIPGNTTEDLLLGSIATSSAQFAVTGIAAGTPTASLSATTNGNGLSLNASSGTIQSLNKGTLTLGGSTTGNINLANPTIFSSSLSLGGDTITDFTGTGLTVSGGALQTTLGVSVDLTSEINGILPIANGGSPFEQNLGAITQRITTQDLLLGSTATSSARFAVINIAGGTPTASLSGSLGGAFLTANGQLQTTNNQSLVLGGGATGNVVVSGLATGVVHSTNGVLSSSDVALGTETSGNYVATINGSSQVGVTGSGSENAGVNLSIVADSIGDAQLTFNTGQDLTSTSNPTFGNLTLTELIIGGDTITDFVGTNTGLTLSSGVLQTTLGTSVDLTSEVNGILPIANGGSPFEQSAGAITERITTQDLLLGSTATSSARFAVTNIAGGTPTASLSAGTAGGSYLTADGTLQTTAFQQLNIGGASTGNIVIDSGNNGIRLADLSTNGVVYTSGGNGTLNSETLLNVARGGTGVNGSSASNGQLLIGNGSGYTLATITAGDGIAITNGAGSITIAQSPFGSSKWTENTTDGTLYPDISTLDLFVGGVSTASAKFAVLNVAGGTPVASVSAGTGGAAFLTADGSLQTTAKQSLTLGGGNSGNVVVSGLATGIVHSTSGILSSSAVNLASEVTGTLPIANGGTGQGSYIAGDMLFYTSGTSLSKLAIGGLNTCLLSTGSAPTWGNCTLGTNYWQSVNAGTITPYNTTADLLFGGVATNSATFHLYGSNALAGTQPVASIAANTSFASLVVNNSGSGDLLTASKGGVPTFTIQNNGAIVDSNYKTAGGVFYGTATGTFGLTSAGSAGQILQSNGAGAPTWIDAGGTINFWQRALGAVEPLNITDDLLLGSNSTSSAKFAFTNVAGGTPTASISAITTNNAVTLDASGNIGTTNKQTLSLGTASTGDINLVVNSGNNLRINGIAGADVTANCVNVSKGIVTSVASCPNAAANLIWNTLSGAIIEGNTTQDLLIGGTASTSASFHVFGAAGFQGTQPVASIAGNTSQAAFIVNNRTGDLFTASSSGLTRFVINNNGNVGLGTALPSTNLEIASTATSVYEKFNPTTNNDWRVGADGFGLSFIDDTAGSTRMTLDENGNMGIGTTDPTIGSFARGLEISGAGAGAALALNATAGKKFIIGAADSPAGLYFQDNTAGIYRMVIDTNGRLGINTGVSSVLGTLDVRGNAATIPTASLSASSTFAGLVVDNSGAGDLFTASSSGATRFVIAQNGRVGINATIPSADLEIDQKNSYTTGFLLKATTHTDLADADAFVVKDENGTSRIYFSNLIRQTTISGGNSAIWNSAGLSVTTDDAGATALRVSGASGSQTGNIFEAYATGTTDRKFAINPSGTISTASVSANTSFAGLVVDNRGAGDLFTASSSGVSQFVIKNGGQVGIGTTLPQARLEVASSADGGNIARFITTANGETDGLNIFGYSSAYTGNTYQPNTGMLYAGTSTQNLQISAAATNGVIKFTAGDFNSINYERLRLNALETLPGASFSAKTSFAGMVVDNRGVGETFTASHGGKTLFTVGNDRVQVGTGGAAAAGGTANPVFFSLDQKGTTGDPANGREGDMYYNTVDDKFRCYQGGAWTDCIATSASEYLRTERQGTQQGTEIDNLTTDHINYNVATGSGSTISLDTTTAYAEGGTGASRGRFTLAGGRTYRLSAYVPVVDWSSSTNGYLDFCWINVGTGARLGSAGGMINVQYSAGNGSSRSNPAEAIITTTSSTVVEVRFCGGTSVSTMGVESSATGLLYPSAFIQTISGAQSVSASEYLRAQMTTNEGTNLANTDHIKFNSVQAFSGNSVTLDTSSTYSTGGGASIGRFTLKAGKTYRLYGDLKYVTFTAASTTSYVYYQWYNVTTSTLLDSQTVLVSDTTTGYGQGSTGFAETVITPSVDTVVELRLNGSNSLTQIGAATIHPEAFIQVLSDGTKVAQFTGATSTTDGAIGYVPAPLAGQQGSLLLGNGTWTARSNFFVGTTLTEPIASLSASTTFAGLVVNNNGSGDLFTASSSGATRFVITQAGNVGIGTTNPTGLFQVNDATGTNRLILGTGGTLGLGTSTPVGHVNIVDTRSAVTAGNENLALFIRQNLATNGLGTGIGFAATTSTAEVGAKIVHIRTGGNSQGDLAFYTKGSAASGDLTTEKLRITGAGTIGVNYGTPSATLDVRGNLVDNSAAGTTPIASLSGKTSFASMVVDNSGAGDLFTASASGLTRFTISNNGNVDIKASSSALLTLENAQGADLITVDSMFNKIDLLASTTGGLGASSWSSTSTLVTAHDGNTVVAANGYLYNVGGASGGSFVGSTDVEYARINTDGSVGTWKTTTSIPDSGRSEHTTVVANGYVYVIGGTNGASKTTVYYARLNPDGTIGSWNGTTAIPNVLIEHSSVVAGNYVYVFGGYNANAADWQTNVYYARLNPDGTLGSWNTATQSLPQKRSNMTAIYANGLIYLLGGKDGTALPGGVKSTIYYARPNPDGNITNGWITTSLPVSRQLGSSVVSNGYIYYIGGKTDTDAIISDVYYAPLNSDGSIGTWNMSTPLLQPRQNQGTAIVNGYIYIVGGGDTVNFSSNTTYYISTARVRIGGNLDLIGLQGQTIASASGDLSLGTTGGSLTAGNGLFVGGLQVIGQTNLTSTLNVNGNFTALGGSFFQNALGTAPVASISANTSFAAMVIDNKGAGDLFTASSSGINRFVIRQNGSVGVNNATGSGRFVITGQTDDASQQNALQITDRTQSGFLFADYKSAGTATPYAWIGSWSNSLGGFQNMVLTGGSGKVGIGTTAPATKLHIEDTTGTTLRISGTNNNSTSSLQFLENGNAAGVELAYDGANNELNIKDYGGSNIMTIERAGNVGIGTNAPGGALEVTAPNYNTGLIVKYAGGGAGAGAALMLDSTAGTSGRKWALIATADSANPATLGSLAVYDETGSQYDFTVKSGGNIASRGTLAQSQNPPDIAEGIHVNDNSINAGDIISSDHTSTDSAAKTTSEYQTDTIGVVSTKPGILMHSGADIMDAADIAADRRALVLAGRVPTKVTSKNGNIMIGDHVTSSDVAGFGKKATKVGTSVGIALENFTPSNSYCPAVSSVEAINWPADDGMNPAKPCFKLPDGTYVGKIMMFVKVTWYDPDIYLTDTGNISVFEKPNAPHIDGTSLFGVTANGQDIQRVGVFSDAVVGNLKAGSLDAQQLTLGGTNLNDKLLGLDNVASVSAGFANPIAQLQTQVLSLQDRVASLEGTLASLTASNSALFMNNPLGNFTASTGAELSLDKLNVNGSIVAGNLNVLGYSTMNELSVTGSIRTGLLTIKGLDNGGASISTLNGDLKLQDGGFGGVDILNGLVTIDTSGNLTSAATITAKKFNVDTSDVLSASVGESTIPLNGTSAVINTTAVTSNSRIFVTSRTKTNLQLSVTTQTAGTSFKVEITSPAPQPIKFDWWIVN